MAVQIQGNTGIISEVDGATFRALRVTPRPFEYGALGHYRVATTVSLVASQAAGSTLFSFRWADATRQCIISKIRVACVQTAAATATIMPEFEVFIARGWSASDSAGTAITLTGNNMKKKVTMGTSLVTDMRFSSLAAGLTVGTRTLDANPIFKLQTIQSITTPTPSVFITDVSIGTGDGNHPIVLLQNEGLIIRGPSVAFGVAGTANLSVEVSWAEVTSY